MSWWAVREHVGVAGVVGEAAEQLAREEIASISRDDGNWTLATLAAQVIGAVSEEWRQEDDGSPEEEVVATLGAGNTRVRACETAEYWLDGSYGPVRLA